MSDADIHAELLRLRKQVEALSAARKQKAKARPDDDAETEPESLENAHTIKKQIEDLMKLLQEEIQDMPAMPTLAVFMLGVLVGRYLR